MDQFHVEAAGTTMAAQAVVWALLADADTWSDWGPWQASGFVSRGDQEASGEGAVRWLKYGRTRLVERIVEVDTGTRMAYTVVKGLPVRNYRAEVALSPAEPGTHVRWTASWDKTIGGKLVLGTLRSAFPEIVAQLLVAADRAG